MLYNQIKTAFFLALLSGVLLGIGFLAGGQLGLIIALGFAILMNFFSYWYSDKIVLKIYKAKEVSEKEAPKLHKMIDELILLYDIPKPKIYLVPDKNANAFATGRNPQNSSVAFTLGIVELMDYDELKGVAAHELAHVQNRDILISSIVAMIATAITYLAFMARFAAFFVGDQEEGASGLELLVMSLLAPVIALIIQTAISRSREYLADETAAKKMKTGLYLANALAKLKADKIEMKLGNASSAHLFIKNPFSLDGFLSVLSTHPPLDERISRLKSMII
jgi:heat shock protein HtpX